MDTKLEFIELITDFNEKVCMYGFKSIVEWALECEDAMLIGRSEVDRVVEYYALYNLLIGTIKDGIAIDVSLINTLRNDLKIFSDIRIYSSDMGAMYRLKDGTYLSL